MLHQILNTLVFASSSLGFGAPKTAPRSGAPLGGEAVEPKTTFAASGAAAFFGGGEDAEVVVDDFLGLALLLVLYFSRPARYDS